VANMLFADHLRRAADASGVINEGDKVRWGLHNLRHSIASSLVQTGPKTVQALLRHADVKTTLQIHALSCSEARMIAWPMVRPRSREFLRLAPFILRKSLGGNER
jgi:integrase